MTSLLRQIVAGPRSQHAETGLDLCYVTSNIIATSGPSQTYPQRAYRNPLDQLVAFLDSKHGKNWAIWEFRAEGTGYPDEAVYGRIRHYPWPDHHPPPFSLVPMIMASMRNWLSGQPHEGNEKPDNPVAEKSDRNGSHKVGENGRVVVVHCKAGKGRSGTMACSYLISECGWTPEEALARFTERRMRPKFGAGVTIPSQLRWVSYVDRWAKHGKKYVDREVEIVEVHVWGLRHGVKVSVEGFVNEGKKIRVFHTFKANERYVMEGDAPGGGGIRDLITDIAGEFLSPNREHGEIVEDTDYAAIVNGGSNTESSNSLPDGTSGLPSSTADTSAKDKDSSSRAASLVRRLSKSKSNLSLTKLSGGKSKTIDSANPSSSPSLDVPLLAGKSDPKAQSVSSLPRTTVTLAAKDEPGGQAVIFKPEQPIRIPNSDINISMERRNRAPVRMGLTMVTSVAHVWFNTYFEGHGPEQGGRPDDSGVFEIEWDKMDGIKGSSQKGTRAAERIAVVWQAVGRGAPTEEGVARGKMPMPAVEIREPSESEEVPQMEPADWKGGNREDPGAEKRLGLRTRDPDSASVSRASSASSLQIAGDGGGEGGGKGNDELADDESIQGVKTSDPRGEELDAEHEIQKKSHRASTQATEGMGDGESALSSAADKTAQRGFIIE